MTKPILEIDGARFEGLEGFYDEVSGLLTRGVYWGRNLDAFNDILRGGFGTPEGGFVLRWTNSAMSRQRIGYPETARWLQRKIPTCHPSNVPSVRTELAEALAGRGPTLFDILTEIIRVHGLGGEEEDDAVELVLA